MSTRRAVLAGLSATALAGPAFADAPDFAVPDGACDCHVHVYDSRFPYAPKAGLKPVPGDVPDYRRDVQSRLKLTRAVLVTPSTYGTDNRCMLDGLAQFSGQARGVAVVAPDVSDAELKALHDGGVRGVRLGYEPEQLEAISRRIAPLGWHMEFFRPAADIAALEPVLMRLPTPLVMDHLAHIPEPEGMNAPGYKTVRRLLDSGRCWLKASGAYIDSISGPPDYADSSVIAKSFIAAAPERMLWATNWPFPNITSGANPRPRLDPLPFLNLFARWVPDAKQRRRILVENPERLYGFDSAARPKPL